MGNYVGRPCTPQQTYQSRPLRGDRLNDTVALVRNGIPPPQALWELNSRPSPEASVTPIAQCGARDASRDLINPSPDRGNTFRRTVDFMRCPKGC